MEEDGKVQVKLRVVPSPFVLTVVRVEVRKQLGVLNVIVFEATFAVALQLALFVPPLVMLTPVASAEKEILNPVNSDVTLVEPFVTAPKMYDLPCILSFRVKVGSSVLLFLQLAKLKRNRVAGTHARVIILVIFIFQLF
ncbi:MAG: hypothetical protein HOP30_14640 [Cyclobacteriaceae bacterium]|nr:hypothetical protein [Cyclobacteriaceae bacterium]